jgi:hypothetical protein
VTQKLTRPRRDDTPPVRAARSGGQAAPRGRGFFV